VKERSTGGSSSPTTSGWWSCRRYWPRSVLPPPPSHRRGNWPPGLACVPVPTRVPTKTIPAAAPKV